MVIVVRSIPGSAQIALAKLEPSIKGRECVGDGLVLPRQLEPGMPQDCFTVVSRLKKRRVIQPSDARSQKGLVLIWCERVGNPEEVSACDHAMRL